MLLRRLGVIVLQEPKGVTSPSSGRSYSTGTPLKGRNTKRLLLMDANGVIYKRVQKKFAKLKSWITETQRASVEQLPGGIDEDSLDSSVSPIVKEELVTLRKAANTGHIPPETYYRKVLETFRVSPSDHVTALQIIKDAESGIKLFDGIQVALTELKFGRGIALGIITDSMSSTTSKLDWIKGQGMDPKIFDFVVNSSELGVTKPHRKMYESAMNLAAPLGIRSVEEAAFVGHKTAELLGAKAMGITTITFNPDEDLKSRLSEFDFNVESWAHIPKLGIFANPTK